MVLGMLTDQQIETYRRDGYLVIPRLIQGEQLAELRDLTDRIVGEARGVSANDDLYDLEPTHSAALPRVRRLKPTIFKRYAFFHALARDPKITAVLAQLLELLALDQARDYQVAVAPIGLDLPVGEHAKDHSTVRRLGR